MCGIVAILGNASHALAKKALNRIRHRGLDATKILCLENIAIGFNRLAINDKTEKGIQPFEFGHLIGVFNGEIYNAEKLRDEFDLHTNSTVDTAIILPLFNKFGRAVIQYLDGFYSGIIYNKDTQQIFLLRDYIGKKPLFYGTSQGFDFIVSELKSVHLISNFEIVPKGFSELIKGEISLIEKHHIPLVSKNLLKETIIEAVKKRIPKEETKFGVFLSGGLDSSIIASIVAKHADNVVYYTLGNDVDLGFVDQLSKKLGIQAKIKTIELPQSCELTALIDKIVYHTESYNPSIISNGLATYLLSSEARKDNLKVILSGEGADEMFCGYKVSKNVNEWFEKRAELIENMQFTELRRLDLASMAHTIEVRCPFLDKKVYAVSNDCSIEDLIDERQGKQILRNAFKDDLPSTIVERDKISFDVGTGIRKMVVEYLTQNERTEKEALKAIWSNYFQKELSHNSYFHAYPTFDKAIECRGFKHKINEIDKIESLLLKEFETVPFHNLFMLNNVSVPPSVRGGTCSDKVLHFKKVLAENGIVSTLHTALINDIACHRMLIVKVDNQKYFIDVGSGWPLVKLLPATKTIEYSVLGMTFKTEFANGDLLLLKKTNHEFKAMITIPLQTKSEEAVLDDISNRYADTSIYPFQKSLRYSKIKDNAFYFIKGNSLKIYNQDKQTEIILSEQEIFKMITEIFNFDLTNLKCFDL